MTPRIEPRQGGGEGSGQSCSHLNAKGRRLSRLRWCGSGGIKGCERKREGQEGKKGKRKRRMKEREGGEETTIEVIAHLNRDRVPTMAGLKALFVPT